MKKLKRIKKPRLKLPKKLPKPPFKKRAKSAEEKVSDALSTVPRITDETVTEHREEMLSTARKYIYPLQQSKHRIVRISIGLLILVLVSFLAATLLSLYRFQATTGFIYDVTRILPFPVAKAGDDWVSYEAYLFELRRNMHYYQTQQQADFSTTGGQEQLKRLKQQALERVVRDAYVKQLAERHGVSVSNRTVDNQVTLVRNQNRLGHNDRVFRGVLQEFWGWSEADFKRELKQQLLQQAVVAKLDTKTRQKAETTLTQLKGGADFATLAGQVSDDAATKSSGGQYPSQVAPNQRDVSPIITAEIFRLQPGQTSDILLTGYTLEIVKVLERSDSSAKAAHIQFNLADINTYVKPLRDKQPPSYYIKV